LEENTHIKQGNYIILWECISILNKQLWEDLGFLSDLKVKMNALGENTRIKKGHYRK